MDLSRQQPRLRRERRIIERPRLIKLLDECEAPIILLLAPAGYGKTTLARQWAKTLNGAIWVSLTPAHRDVARLAEDIASGIDALGGQAHVRRDVAPGVLGDRRDGVQPPGDLRLHPREPVPPAQRHPPAEAGPAAADA